MKSEEKIKICSTCQNRKFSAQKGVICGLTGEKPQFDEECESYLIDEFAQAKSEIELKQEEDGGYDDENIDSENSKTMLPGAGWFQTIAILSILNIGLYFIDVSFVFGLASTQLMQVAMEIEFINPIAALCCMIFMPAFYYITWYLTAKKGYKFAYNIGYAVYALDTALVIILLLMSKNPTWIVDILFHLVALFGGFKIFQINARKTTSIEPASPQTKVLYALAAGAAAVISILSIITFTNNQELTEDNISVLVKNVNRELPAEIEDGVVYTRMYLDGKKIVNEYRLEVSIWDMDRTALSSFKREGKSDVLRDIRREYAHDKDFRSLIDFVMEYDYDIVCNYVDANYQPIHSITLTSSEIEMEIVD